ncbi:hypothetical protein G5O_0897 [Chlamydia psittaci 6BC]|nr:hypothetical protein G5O_0897 [Chlamydia psittaci 6BC]
MRSHGKKLYKNAFFSWTKIFFILRIPMYFP